jgi:hypothetical protein
LPFTVREERTDAKIKDVQINCEEYVCRLPKREKGAWRKLRNEEHSNLYYSRNIIRVIRRRRLRWTGHVEHMEALRSAQK